MPLNESKGNMYTWSSHQWNPISGDCEHNCSYCYVGRWGKKHPLHLVEKCFKDDLGNGNTIFVVSGSDMFASNVPREWIDRVLKYCCQFDNTYLFQSKNPERFWNQEMNFPAKRIFCTTIETNRIYPEMGNTPTPANRALGMWNLRDEIKYVTLEPLFDFDLEELIEIVKMCEPTQVNIGADSGNNHLPEPSKDKLIALIGELKKFTVIDQKRNLDRLLR